MKYPKELLQLERHAFAVLKAMPDLKAAHDMYVGADLYDAIEKIEVQYGLSTGA